MNTKRKIVILNQATNYLTIGYANAFKKKFDEVVLITGSIHTQGEQLNKDVLVYKINRWYETPARKKTMSYLAALWKMWWLLAFKYRKHEVFFISVPPMAYLLNLLLPHKFSMLIWDVYPDILKITGMTEKHLLCRIWAYLNKISFKKADKIFTIGTKISELLEQYVQTEKIIIQPIWSIFQENLRVDVASNPFVKKYQHEGKFIVQYSGNIGLTHKVELMIKLAELLKDQKSIIFQIIGRGVQVPYLKKLVEKKKLPNCMLLPFQSDEMFLYSLSAADLGVVILDEKTAKGSVPSKSYNLMSLGIPSLYLASTDSELNNYVQKFRHGKCFQERNLEEAAKFIHQLAMSSECQKSYSENALQAAQNFKRGNADKLVDKYLSC